MLRNLEQFPQEDRSRILDWVLRFQQVTGPIMAKGIEDTAFYVYNELVSLNEVGGHPDRCESTLQSLPSTERRARRALAFRDALHVHARHEEKRGCSRRINVLAELVEEWNRNVTHWLSLTRSYDSQVEEKPAPTVNDRYLLYQTLLGTWPDPAPSTAQELAAYRDRIMRYMEKAIKEAKQNTG